MKIFSRQWGIRRDESLPSLIQAIVHESLLIKFKNLRVFSYFLCSPGGKIFGLKGSPKGQMKISSWRESANVRISQSLSFSLKPSDLSFKEMIEFLEVLYSESSSFKQILKVIETKTWLMYEIHTVMHYADNVKIMTLLTFISPCILLLLFEKMVNYLLHNCCHIDNHNHSHNRSHRNCIQGELRSSCLSHSGCWRHNYKSYMSSHC